MHIWPAAPYLACSTSSVTNPLDVERLDEIVDLPLSEVLHQTHAKAADQIVVVDDVAKQRLPSQTYSTTGTAPDRFLILVKVPAHATLHLSFQRGGNPAPIEPLVFGREAPERKDDFAWENQLVAYRVYGPALQATGEITSGIDVWSKRVPNFVINTFYKRDAEGQRTKNPALSYHKDNGQGLDSYEVGPSRGCGGTAVFADGKLYVSKNYTSLKQLSTGPIRFAFELSYAPWEANGVEVTETKRITLDAGSRLNRIDSTFTFSGDQTIDAAAGLAVHKGADPEQLEKRTCALGLGHSAGPDRWPYRHRHGVIRRTSSNHRSGTCVDGLRGEERPDLSLRRRLRLVQGRYAHATGVGRLPQALSAATTKSASGALGQIERVLA